jgi:hypothetical protein
MGMHALRSRPMDSATQIGIRLTAERQGDAATLAAIQNHLQVYELGE